MAIGISIIFSPIWQKITPYLHVVECAEDGGVDTRIRIEFLEVPEPLMRDLVTFQMPCVACERPNHPLRRREGDAWDMGRLYYAPTCPIAVRMACARGRAAELEYERFKGAQIERPAGSRCAPWMRSLEPRRKGNWPELMAPASWTRKSIINCSGNRTGKMQNPQRSKCRCESSCVGWSGLVPPGLPRGRSLRGATNSSV